MNSWRTAMTALITPFDENGKVDISTFKTLIQEQLKSHIGGLIPCGTTGESFLLSLEEHKLLLETCVKEVNGQIPVIAGAGGLTVEQTLALAKNAEEAGADGLLIVTPFYIKPSQEALIEYYTQIHDATTLPIMLYNNPGRAGVELSISTILELSTLPRVVALKDSSTDMTRVMKLRMALGDDFVLLSGDDFTVGAYLAQGGDGVISVATNIMADDCMKMMHAWNTGDRAQFRLYSQRLLMIANALFTENSPAGIKYMLSLKGIGNGLVRSPLTELSLTAQKVVEIAFDTWASEHAFDSLLKKNTSVANQG